METVAWKLELPPVPRDDEIEALENRLALATERAEQAEAQANRALQVALALSGRIERKTLKGYDKGFEAAVARSRRGSSLGAAAQGGRARR